MPDIIRVSFDRPAPVQGNLFGGAAWIWAASIWCAQQGLQTERWEMGRRFKAGGQWYAIGWNAETELWDVTVE
jgi:hypothetical protein